MFKRMLTGAAAAALTLVVATSAQAQTKDIVDTAVGAGSFKTLAKLLTDAGLVDTLKGAGPVHRVRARPTRRSPRCPRPRSTRSPPTRPS